MLVLFAVACHASPAQDAAPKPGDLLQRLEQVERELRRLKSQLDNKAPAVEGRVLALLDTPYLGTTYRGTLGGRQFFVARLILVNLSSKPLEIERQQITLSADGHTYEQSEVPEHMKFQTAQVGHQSIPLRNVSPAERLEIKPDNTGQTWVVFSDLPQSTGVPQLKLMIETSDEPIVIDVNAYAERQLGLTVDRIGPRGSLGLITLAGDLDPINMRLLVNAIERLTADRVVRVVIRWEPDAPILNSAMRGWLTFAAASAGTQNARRNVNFPPMPGGLRELHLAELPAGRTSVTTVRSTASESIANRIHTTTVAAVTESLRTAYERIPLSEVIADIEGGNHMTRVAALAAGGSRLPPEQLPRLIELSAHDDRDLQLAAIRALGHFGEPSAIATLIAIVRKDTPVLSGVAIEALAGSRFAAAHESLLELLRNESAESRKRIIQVLAMHPRPVWADTIYQYASDPNSGLVPDAVQALSHIGHPQLTQLLADALRRSDSPMRDQAFEILAERLDPESEDVAITYTLEQLKSTPPTPGMLKLIARTRDPRAIAPLLAQLESADGKLRASMIDTLGRIGDQTIADVFVHKFPELSAAEQVSVLGALAALRSPDYRQLAGKALMGEHSSLVSVAARGLQADGTTEAVNMLGDALRNSSRTSTWSYAANALGAIGTREAREILNAFRDDENESRRNYVQQSLRNMERQSPGYQYVVQAQQHARDENWPAAIEQYSDAIKADDQLSTAWTGRGLACLQTKEYDKALIDFERGLELDSHNGLAVTGKALVQVMLDNIRPAIEIVESARDRFKRDALFAYNSACVFSRAVESARASSDPDAKANEERWAKQAIDDLHHSVTLGFRDTDHIRKDPDLKAIDSLPRFQQILKQVDDEDKEQ